MGVNVTPPACGRQGTLIPHFSAYRAIFSDMSSPESGYCSIVIHLSWFPIQTYDHVFADILLEFDRVFDNCGNRSVLENTDLLSLTEKRSVFSNTDLFLFMR